MHPFLQTASLATQQATGIPEGTWLLRANQFVRSLGTYSIPFVTVLAHRPKAEDYRSKQKVIVHDITSRVFIDIHDDVAAGKAGVSVGQEVLLVIHADGEDQLATFFSPIRSPIRSDDWYAKLRKTVGPTAGLPDGCLRLLSDRPRFIRTYSTTFERTNMIFTATNKFEREVNDFQNPPPLSVRDYEWYHANRLRRMLDDASPAEREEILANLRREVCKSTSACEAKSAAATASFVCPKTGKPCGTES